VSWPRLATARRRENENETLEFLGVDGYSDAADMTADLLRPEGYEVVAAHHRLQAVEVAREFRPDLVLLDINMPVMDGYTAAKTLRQEQPPETKLVLIAHIANPSPSDVHRAIEGGFDRYIRKPIVVRRCSA